MIPHSMGCILLAALLRHARYSSPVLPQQALCPQIGQMPSYYTLGHVTTFP